MLEQIFFLLLFVTQAQKRFNGKKSRRDGSPCILHIRLFNSHRHTAEQTNSSRDEGQGTKTQKSNPSRTTFHLQRYAGKKRELVIPYVHTILCVEEQNIRGGGGGGKEGAGSNMRCDFTGEKWRYSSASIIETSLMKYHTGFLWTISSLRKM